MSLFSVRECVSVTVTTLYSLWGGGGGRGGVFRGGSKGGALHGGDKCERLEGGVDDGGGCVKGWLYI